MGFLRSLRLDGLLSFAPGSAGIPLTPLNVLIGPNGSGKSNLVEAIELLHATPTAFAAAIRDGGGAGEWLWKGTDSTQKVATIEAVTMAAPLNGTSQYVPELRYRLSFTAVAQRTELTDEVIERTDAKADQKDVFFYYRFQNGTPAINVRQKKGDAFGTARHLERQSLPLMNPSYLSVRILTCIRS